MSAFGMIESFFFLSLGVVFVLLILLVYHFKQRIATIEQKSDTMFDIVQDLAKELTGMKSLLVRPQYVSAVLDEEEYEDKEVEEEEESDEEESDEEESDEEEEESDEEVKVIELNSIDHNDDSVPDSDEVKVLKISAPLDVSPPAPVTDSNSIQVYKKMSVGTLRALVISKGLRSDTSKLGKGELLKLLS